MEKASLLSILTIIFMILKLCGVINWSWFFVLLPSIINLGIILIIGIIWLIVYIKYSK